MKCLFALLLTAVAAPGAVTEVSDGVSHADETALGLPGADKDSGEVGPADAVPLVSRSVG
jgi:hypothetical protein